MTQGKIRYLNTVISAEDTHSFLCLMRSILELSDLALLLMPMTEAWSHGVPMGEAAQKHSLSLCAVELHC